MTKYAYITKHNSPNFTPKRSVPRIYGRKRVITAITIHHWGIRGQDFDAVVRYLCRKGGSTSAHEVIEAGRVAVIVNHKNAAWHAGNATGNATTVGLELRPEATNADYATAAERIAELRKTYGNITLVPHSSWKATACPGAWDLARLDREARAIAAGGSVKPTVSAKPKPKPKPKPNAKPAKAWPSMKLRADGQFGALTITALQIMLAGHPEKSVRYTGRIDGKFEGMTADSMQRWLKWLGKYSGKIDGKFGPMSVRALQAFLVDKKLLPGAAYIDGSWKAKTTKALQKYINTQAPHYRK